MHLEHLLSLQVSLDIGQKISFQIVLQTAVRHCGEHAYTAYSACWTLANYTTYAHVCALSYVLLLWVQLPVTIRPKEGSTKLVVGISRTI